MKGLGLSIVLSLASLVLSAQEIMKIEKKDGSTIACNVNDIKRFYFTEIEEPVNTKKLVRIEVTEVESNGGFDHDSFLLNYDDQGRLTSFQRDAHEMVSIVYGQDVISWTISESTFQDRYTYDLSNDGMIKRCIHETSYTPDNWRVNSTSDFYYSSSNRLERLSETYGDIFDYWNLYWYNDIFHEGFCNEEGEAWEQSLVYNSNLTCKGYNPVILTLGLEDDVDELILLLAHPELVGFKTNNLPTYLEERDYAYSGIEDAPSDIIEFTYDFYEDGYLKTCRGIWNESQTEWIEYRFSWE